MDVKININTIQYDEHSKIDIINVNTVGTLHEKNDATYLMYKEDNEGVEITTSIKVSKKEITIKRFGASNSTMVFEKGKVHTSNYKTPYGLFLIETHTKHLDVDNNSENNFKIELDYNLKMNDMFNGRNKITINVEK
ncbi:MULTISPECIES: DUF1934 domain-containing protein [unclassified Romboutsia]|uniref:DUF1934 domain-containing protein n=1 Tax=unclassified Romboutsia TaxID=2626894 RepID=UPI000822A01C|nr:MULTISPECIES: DUF1934 domain-containing protein [unclassified Romboutsia]SCI31109.1 Uncharacterized beta-barrel protein ywiB [uncultured Clostridium sp.]